MMAASFPFSIRDACFVSLVQKDTASFQWKILRFVLQDGKQFA
jgi:hypothetical protein